MRLNIEGAEGKKPSALHIVSEETNYPVSGQPGNSGNVQSSSNLVAEVARKTGCVYQVSWLIDQTVSLTKIILNAAASSVLLVDEGRQELFFEFADGEVGGALKRVRMSIQSGIAGWVARHGKPVIVNDVAKDRRFFKGMDKATGFITKSIVCAPLVVRNKVIGVLEVLNKLDGSDFTEQDLKVLETVAATAAQGIDNLRIHEELLYGYCNAVKALATVIDDKDPYTCGHSQRVKEYALLGARALSLPMRDLEAIEYAGLLHDIGKIGIPDAVLRKPGPLTIHEWSLMKDHPRIGASIVGNIPYLEDVKNLIISHHERYDGKGYPRGIGEEDIPIGARLLSVADAFDTMVTNRAYRAAISVDKAIEELRRCAGTQFCPRAVKAFVSGLMEFQGRVGQPYH